jgi:poly(hydroxyalkanoate) depolymerase family esterase
VGKLLGRVVAWLRRIFGREEVPGRFEPGKRFAWGGRLASAPFLWPSREYLVYVPRNHQRRRRVPLLVLCHGCKQTPEDIARGTRIAALADERGFIVLLPRQSEDANQWRCWTWFDSRTAGGGGEAAIVAAQMKEIMGRYRIDRTRVIAAGMSAGGALAAVLGVRYPALVKAVVAHSGLPCGAASSPMKALRVMADGPDQDVGAIGDSARRKAPPRSLPVPLLAIHGGKDDVVVPRHAIALVVQYLRLNGHPAAGEGANAMGTLPTPDRETRTALPSGREEIAREWRIDGRLVARYVEIATLGHAWSGGDAALPFNDAQAPDATALLGAFIDEALR